MYEPQKDQYTPENSFAGDFPHVKEVLPVASGTTVRRLSPVVLADGNAVEAEAPSGSGDSAKPGNLNHLYALAAADSSGGQVVCYLTGEFFADALTLPNNVTIDDLKPAFRKLGIFLK